MIEIIPTGHEHCAYKLKQLLTRRLSFDPDLMMQVSEIIDDVRARGDAALIDYTKRFDRVELTSGELRVSEESLQSAAVRVGPKVIAALRDAIHNVREFHQQQLECSWQMNLPEGVLLGQRVHPIDSVGLYVPGGTAAYPSSVLMNVIPAQIAAVKRIAVATPPHTLVNNPAVAAALMELNIDEVYSVGGAQAIAALAYGTETIRAVDKITGPGNRFVAAAKKLVFGVVGIDSIAGPTEIVIIADDSARPDYVAADLLAQAEHGEDSTTLLITTNSDFANTVLAEMLRRLPSLERHQTIEKALRKYGLIVVVESVDEACAIANQLAPEHVQVMTQNADVYAELIRNAGAVFIGSQTPAAVGDYFAGPNHVLPTGGAARFSSPLSVGDFMKRTNVLRYSETAMRAAAESIATLATVEGLTAHAASALIRTKETR